MDLIYGGDGFNSDFLFEAQNKFVLFNVCDNYLIVNITEFYRLKADTNGILMTLWMLIFTAVILKILDLLNSRFILKDIIFIKKYKKLKEITMAFVMALSLILVNILMPKKIVYGIEQNRSSFSILFIFLFCMVIPLSLFTHLGEIKGILVPRSLFLLTIATIIANNVILEIYVDYTNRVDYIMAVFLLACFIFYCFMFVIISKIDISNHRNMCKKEGFKLTSNYITLNFEIEELTDPLKLMDDYKEKVVGTMGTLLNTTDSHLMDSSLSNSNLQSNIFIMNTTLDHEPDLIHYQKKDSLETYLTNYNLELEQRIRKMQKHQVEEDFSKKLFYNEDEQKEILRNKKISLWDKVFIEFSSPNPQTRPEKLFDKFFTVILALCLPSLKNPLMETSWAPFIVSNSVICILIAHDFIYKFQISYLWFIFIGVTISTMVSIFKRFSIWSFSWHRTFCSFLCICLGFILIVDSCLIFADFLIFFAFYFRYDLAMTLGLMRAIRYLLPCFYIINQLCKAGYSMVAFLLALIFIVGNSTLILAISFFNSVQDNQTRYNSTSSILSVYNKRSASLLSMASYYMFFYCILMSLLMIIKKYRFDTGLMFLSCVLFGVFCYTID